MGNFVNFALRFTLVNKQFEGFYKFGVLRLIFMINAVMRRAKNT